MRKFRVFYWTEKNDDCVDCETIIEARHIVEVFAIFQEKIKVFKRVFKIEEI